MAQFWSMVVDDVAVDSEQNPKERSHRNRMIVNVNDIVETLISDMLKNVQEACEALDATNYSLEKATLAAAMESKVTLVVTIIRTKI